MAAPQPAAVPHLRRTTACAVTCAEGGTGDVGPPCRARAPSRPLRAHALGVGRQGGGRGRWHAALSAAGDLVMTKHDSLPRHDDPTELEPRPRPPPEPGSRAAHARHRQRGDRRQGAGHRSLLSATRHRCRGGGRAAFAETDRGRATAGAYKSKPAGARARPWREAASPNTVHFKILIAAVKSIHTVGSGVRDRSG